MVVTFLFYWGLEVQRPTLGPRSEVPPLWGLEVLRPHSGALKSCTPTLGIMDGLEVMVIDGFGY